MSNLVSRNQLVTTFGVGSIYTFPSGDSGICAGLDHWFDRATTGEFQIDEPRIGKLLGLKDLELRSPPDWRKPEPGNAAPNLNLTVKFLRFPQWHVCSACKLMKKVPLFERGEGLKCGPEECGKPNLPIHARQMRQVRFVAMCSNGHVHDFPWVEWVHKGTGCQSPKLKMRQTGGAGLEGLLIKCEGEGCGRERSLSGITSIADYERGTTRLSSSLLEGDEVFLCRGIRPWLGEPYQDDQASRCEAHMVATLRNASNLYYASVVSALHVPPLEANLPVELLDEIRGDENIKMLMSFMEDGRCNTRVLDKVQDRLKRVVVGGNQWPPETIVSALEYIAGLEGTTGPAGLDGDDRSPQFLIEEWNALQQTMERANFVIEHHSTLEAWSLPVLEGKLEHWFDGVSLVKRLKETRCLVGFTRVNPEDGTGTKERMERLWKKAPDPLWLPAYETFGEGIFFRLSMEKLVGWEKSLQQVGSQRLREIERAAQESRERNGNDPRFLGPRFVLVHTLAHLLINRLVFECGYGSASLRERIYVSRDEGENAGMAGFLIYTASGDSEGSMGGLVRMGQPGRLEPLIHRALEGAQWCSNDPICMELAESGGQGPDSANLAACHSCCLLPETSCTEFNKFLDRGFVVGTLEMPSLGFFKT